MDSVVYEWNCLTLEEDQRDLNSMLRRRVNSPGPPRSVEEYHSVKCKSEQYLHDVIDRFIAIEYEIFLLTEVQNVFLVLKM